ncbi:MAG: HAD family phosphatase, partial [Acidobacteriota bacterium]
IMITTVLFYSCGEENKAPISVIVFDVGGVLSKDMIDTKLIDLADSYDLDVDSLLSAKSQYRDLADLGEISDSEFWVQILDHFGVQATEEDKEIYSYIVLVDGTLDIARSLSGKYKTAILSNDSKEMGALRRKKFGFDEIFDPIIISGYFGVKKPDAGIYNILLEKLGVPAEECLFIDNNQDNVDGARAAGIQAILFKNSEHLRRELLNHGIEIDS